MMDGRLDNLGPQVANPIHCLARLAPDQGPATEAERAWTEQVARVTDQASALADEASLRMAQVVVFGILRRVVEERVQEVGR